MHNARLADSPRLQRVARVLSDLKPHTTRDIIRSACVCAVNSAISELRANGMKVLCKREGDIWRYQLLRQGAA